ncbi:dihydropteroate synthase [Nocardioides terrisoli]|uniref:dihydropteroate synthase n=1 Tax=Nocardioides terrisoli TaxID=3388267 RepID=UPI00287B6B66|nr:dihydropteroate synthase [Nocardioides marmorisolisilvae]
MISLRALARLAQEHGPDLDLPVAPFRVGDRLVDTDAEPVLMGTVNLSPDSTYRESVALSTESAIRKARVQIAQGAHLVDIGAESSTLRAARVEPSHQAAALVPVIEALAAEGIVVSVEAYDVDVVEAGLKAGARVVNLTGSADDEAVFETVARHGASLVLCQVTGANVREVVDAPVASDPFPSMLDHFGPRIELARRRGVEHLAVDPGLGFYYGNLTEPMVRLRYQTSVILSTFRLRRLGLPVCHALPHAFMLFEDEFRTAESFFAVLAALGGTGVLRTHEVPRVRAVIDALTRLDVVPTAR